MIFYRSKCSACQGELSHRMGRYLRNAVRAIIAAIILLAACEQFLL